MRPFLEKIKHEYDKLIKGKNEETRFLILTSFTMTFLIARLIVYNITFHIFTFLPTGNVYIHDTHIHHLVFGILLLIISGFIRTEQFGTKLFRLSSIMYGVGAALTLDEFALWLRFDPTAYFGPQGRISIDAVVIFTLILLSTLWHGAFWRKLFHYGARYLLFKKN